MSSMRKRRLLAAAAAAPLAACGGGMNMGAGGTAFGTGAPQLPEGLPLAVAPAISGSGGLLEATLRAAAAQFDYVGGRATDVLA